MNNYTILLVACLVTAPAVAAETMGTGPLACDLDLDTGYCSLNDGQHSSNGPDSIKQDCPYVWMNYNFNHVPPTADPDVRTECI